MELKTLAKLLRKAGELFLVCECAQNYEYLLPFLQVGVLDNVRKVVRNDALEEAQVRRRSGALLEVELLRLGEQLGTGANGEVSKEESGYCTFVQLPTSLEVVIQM